MDVLDWVTGWYEAQCNGDWEHSFGIVIDTIDNPGWSIKIDLKGTDCDARALEKITYNYEDGFDWWACWTEENVFHGVGGPLHLRSLLDNFRSRAMGPPSPRA